MLKLIEIPIRKNFKSVYSTLRNAYLRTVARAQIQPKMLNFLLQKKGKHFTFKPLSTTFLLKRERFIKFLSN